MHKDANGEKFCLMNLIDTTHRWKAEQAIAEERTFLQHVIDGIEGSSVGCQSGLQSVKDEQCGQAYRGVFGT